VKLFGKKLFGKGDDDEDDDDFDAEDFELDDEDLDAEAQQAERDELNEALEAQATRDDEPDDGDAGAIDHDFADLPPDDSPSVDPMADGEEILEGSSGADDLDDGDVDVPEFEDDEYDEDDDDDEYDDEDDDEPRGGLLSNPTVRYALIGFTIVLLLGSAGIAFKLFVLEAADEEIVAEDTELRGQPLGEALPAENTISLNDLASGGGGGLQPPPGDAQSSEEAAAEDGVQVIDQLAGDGAPEAVAGSEAAMADQFASEGSGGLNAFAGGGLNALAPGTSGNAGAGVIVPMSMASAYSRYPDIPGIQPLPNAPEPDLIEVRGDGARPLPKKGGSDRSPFSVYARPAELAEGQAHVALVVTDLGLNRAGTIAAIRKLPPEVTLSFSPYAEELDQWMIRARRAGHEVMVGLPMESDRFPIEDPGPLGLMTVLPEDQNMLRLYDVLSLFQGFIGVEVVMGDRYTLDPERLRPILGVLADRGLMILDTGQNDRSALPDVARELRVPFALSDVRIDTVMARSAIDDRLKQLEETARTRRAAIGRTTVNPAIIDRLSSWFVALQINNIRLVPLSAITNRQDLS